MAVSDKHEPTIVQSAVSTTVSTPALESLSNANSARKGPKKEALRGADSEEWESTDAASVFLRDGGKGEAKGNLADVPFAGKRFCFYQGEFKEGQRSGEACERLIVIRAVPSESGTGDPWTIFSPLLESGSNGYPYK